MYEQGSLTREAAVQSWLGKTIMLSLDGASTASWSGLSDPTWLDPADGWPAWQSSVPGRHLLITVDMLPTPPEGGTVSLAECASHDYDSHWITLAQNLVAWNLGDAILRLGHEFNGNWYPWAAFVPPSTPPSTPAASSRWSRPCAASPDSSSRSTGTRASVRTTTSRWPTRATRTSTRSESTRTT
jgi:hypothetical protein